jgi:hypothetical protein
LRTPGSSSSGQSPQAPRSLLFGRAQQDRRTGRHCRRRRLGRGPAARSRLVAFRASEKPHNTACIGSRLVVSVANAPQRIVRAGNPGIERLDAAHDLVARAIDRSYALLRPAASSACASVGACSRAADPA